ncbi:MAG: chemoreceptor glutamine deamidase CheD [Xanthomonadales bacterium]|nr:chemoreceptor glutamine deamidase CheD [Xanthomonadales bacterium]
MNRGEPTVPTGGHPELRSEAFAKLRRHRLGNEDRWVVRIGPGDYYATADGELISTTLGSCIAACIRNPATGVGGMNHFLLPDSWEGSSRWESTMVSSPARYGNVAMERLINVVLGDHARREELEIKVFGGAKVLRANIDIGERNISFVKSYLRTEGLRIAAQDMGGTAPRRLVYDPRTGVVFVKNLGVQTKQRIAHDELEHMEEIRHHSVGGDVDLFDMPGDG